MLKLRFFTGVRNGEDLHSAMYDYHQHCLCLPAATSLGGLQSEYAASVNRRNLIKVRIPSFNRLVHVASFNQIVKRIPASETFKRRFSAITGITIPTRQGGLSTDDVDDIANELAGEVATIKKVAGLLIEFLGDTQPPWWACFAEQSQGFIQAEDWSGLCKALGLGDLREGDQLLIWEYEVQKVGNLYRPTSLEAGRTGYHYPSPPSCDFGITMPLENGLPLCREVLHRPLSPKASEEACTGKLCKLGDFAINYHQIPQLRQNHHKNLKKEFTKNNDQDWLKRTRPF